jgi:hypothetical protein
MGQVHTLVRARNQGLQGQGPRCDARNARWRRAATILIHDRGKKCQAGGDKSEGAGQRAQNCMTGASRRCIHDPGPTTTRGLKTFARALLVLHVLVSDPPPTSKPQLKA